MKVRIVESVGLRSIAGYRRAQRGSYGRSTDRDVGEAEFLHHASAVDVAAVKDEFLIQERSDPLEIRRAEFIPLSGDNQRVGFGDALVHVLIRRHFRQFAAQILDRFGVVGAPRCDRAALALSGRAGELHRSSVLL